MNIIKPTVKKLLIKLKLYLIKLGYGKIVPVALNPNKMYSSYCVYDNDKSFWKRIILPYSEVNLSNIYDEYRPYEVLDGVIIEQEQEKNIPSPSECKTILPIAIVDTFASALTSEQCQIDFNIGNKPYSIELMYKNRFHYLPIEASTPDSEIKILPNKNTIIVGKPISRNAPKVANKPKLIVHIMIDALPQTVLDDIGLQTMPNTNKFFNNGCFCANAYAQAEWTLSSMAGVFTGKYTANHMIFHPRKAAKINSETIAEMLHKEGYLTFGCTAVPKLSPKWGFDKGFDRYLHSYFNDYRYIIDEALEQLQAFPDRNQYLFLSMFDIHEAHKLQPISSQLSCSINDFKYKKITGNSKNTDPLFDEQRINRLASSLTHLDSKLNTLYKAIEEIDQEALVILHSDHGINYNTRTRELLGKERIKGCCLIRSPKIDSQTIKEPIEINGIKSTIANLLGIKSLDAFDSDSILNSKNHVITESLYPNKLYELAIRSSSRVLFFKMKPELLFSKKNTDLKYETKYHNIDNEIEVAEIDDEYYRLLKIALNHILLFRDKTGVF